MDAVPSILVILPSLAGGGAERASINLANALRGDGCRVTLATVHGGGPLSKFLDPTIDREDLGSRRVSSALLKLPGLVRRMNPDVVLCTPAHLNLAVLLARPWFPAGTQVFVREANTPSMTLPTQPVPALFKAVSRFLYPRADAVLCPAHRIADELTSLFGVPASRVHVLPNSVDGPGLVKARASPIRRPGRGVRLVAAGRLTRQKNFAALLQSMRKLPGDATLELFGAGPLSGELELMVEQFALSRRVTLHGFSDEVWRWFAGADALVLPSLWEGMPNVALEALGCGARVVAMRSAGGIAELANKHGDALLLVDDELDLTRTLALLTPAQVHFGRSNLLAADYREDTAIAMFKQLIVPSAGGK